MVAAVAHTTKRIDTTPVVIVAATAMSMISTTMEISAVETTKRTTKVPIEIKSEAVIVMMDIKATTNDFAGPREVMTVPYVAAGINGKIAMIIRTAQTTNRDADVTIIQMKDVIIMEMVAKDMNSAILETTQTTIQMIKTITITTTMR